MAPYYFDQNLQDEEEKQADPRSVQISGASPTTNTSGYGASGQVNGQPNKPLDTGSGFQNVNKYLNNNNSQEFGQEILGKVRGEIGDAQASQKQSTDTFKKQVGDLNQIPNAQDIDNAIVDPFKADKNKIQAQLNQQYNSPSYNYGNYSEKPQQSANALTSDEGRKTLLGSYYSRPDYTPGEKNLDNLFLQKGISGQDARGLQNQAASLKGQEKNDVKDLDILGSAQKNLVDQSRTSARNKIGIDDQGQILQGDKAGALGKYYENLQNQFDQASSRRLSDQSQILKDLDIGEFTDDELRQLGLIEGEELYTLTPDLRNLTTPTAAVTKGQIYDKDEQAYLQALSDLAGVDNLWGGITPEALNNDYNFDIGAFRQAQGNIANTVKANIDNFSDQNNWELSGLRSGGVFNNNPNVFSGIPAEGAPIQDFLSWAQQKGPEWQELANEPYYYDAMMHSFRPTTDSLWAQEMISKYGGYQTKLDKLNSDYGTANKVKRRA